MPMVTKAQKRAAAIEANWVREESAMLKNPLLLAFAGLGSSGSFRYVTHIAGAVPVFDYTIKTMV